MARSSTTIKPGERLALKHGMYSRPKIEDRLPEIRAWLEERLAENPIPNQTVDEPLRLRYCWLGAQAQVAQEQFDAQGGLYTESGAPKKGAQFLLQIYDRLEKMERIMGIGALPRAQTAQLTANASLNQTAVRDAQERLRARQNLRLIEGAS